jgi:hypothetical protein
MELIGSPETSDSNQLTPQNNPEHEKNSENGGVLFDRSKLTTGCSANGKRRKTTEELRSTVAESCDLKQVVMIIYF